MKPLSSVAVVATVLLAGLAGCASPSASGTVYRAGEARREQIVRMGVIESVREVTIQGDPTPVGPLAGAVVGGIAGSDIGGGKGSTIASVLGAVAGSMAGSAIERNVNTRKGLELTVKLDSGELRAYVQEADEMFKPGDRVRLVSTGGITRVTR